MKSMYYQFVYSDVMGELRLCVRRVKLHLAGMLVEIVRSI